MKGDNPGMSGLMRIALAIVMTGWAVAAMAQSPNTGSIVIVVVDQTGALVRDAEVIVANSATGASRQASSNEEGSATIPTLPLTGEYKVSVAKPGFRAEDVPSLTLRAGETATVKISLVASGGQSEVTVYGTAQGVR